MRFIFFLINNFLCVIFFLTPLENGDYEGEETSWSGKTTTKIFNSAWDTSQVSTYITQITPLENEDYEGRHR